MNTDLIVRNGSLLIPSGTFNFNALTASSINFSGTPSLGNITGSKFLILDGNNNITQISSASVVADLFITNGNTSAGRNTLLSVIDSTTILAKSLSITGSGGIGIVPNISADSVDYVIDGSALVSFSSGLYADRPQSALLGQQYYQTDLLEGLYVWDGGDWAFIPDNNTEIFCKFLGNVYPMNSNISGSSGAAYQETGKFSSWRLNSGTGTLDYTNLTTAQNISYGGGTGKIIMYYNDIYVSATSSATNRYVVRLGRRHGSDVDSMHFRYTDNVNSGNWQCITYSGSTATTTNLTTSIDSTTTGSSYLVVLDQSGVDNVKFYRNNILVATHTTTIPKNFSNGYMGSVSIEKTAGTGSIGLVLDDAIIKRIR